MEGSLPRPGLMGGSRLRPELRGGSRLRPELIEVTQLQLPLSSSLNHLLLPLSRWQGRG